MLRKEQDPVSGSTSHAPWYLNGLRFQCSRCGRCCSGAPGYVWVTSDEINRIARFLALTPSDFQRRHVRRVGFGRSLLERPGGDCEFLQRAPDGATSCAIHPVRPVQCRTWPFWSSNLETRGAWTETATECPGIGRGPLHPLTAILAALNENGTRPL